MLKRNNNIEQALEIIEEEYFKLEKSTDRYTLMDYIQNELKDMKNRAIQEYRSRDELDAEKVLKGIFDNLCAVSDVDPEMAVTPDCTVLQLKNIFEIDSWDWIDAICEIEVQFKVSIDEKFDADDAVLKDLIDYILIYAQK